MKKTKKIALIGGPGCGKSTLALDLTAYLKRQGVDARFISEYPTDYINNCGPPKTFYEQINIYYGQKKKEAEFENLKNPPDVIICDYAGFVAFVYYMTVYRPKKGKELIRKYEYLYGEFEKICREDIKDYDLIFLLNSAEIPFKKDGIRFQKDKEEGLIIDRNLENWMNMVQAHHDKISGCPDERLKKVLPIIKTA